MDIKKGQKIWIWVDSKIGGNEIKTTVVSSGKKYITTDCGIKYYRDTLTEVNGLGNRSYIIPNIEEYYEELKKIDKINKIKNIKWECVEKEDLDNIYAILRNYH